MRKITFLMLLVALCSFSNLNAQTTLTPGDVVIVAVNSDGDDAFDFVPLVDLEEGTVIKFTERAVLSDGITFRDEPQSSYVEGTLTYTVPAGGKTKGTTIHCPGKKIDASTANWTKEGTYAISGSGDNLVVYQGDDSSHTFIYGIGWALSTSWVTSGDPKTTKSYKPKGLSENQIVNLASKDNYVYTGKIKGTKEELLKEIANPDNWTADDKNAQTFSDNLEVTSATNTNIFHREVISANAWVANGQVNVKATAGEKVEVFNAIGQKVISTTAKEGINTLSTNAKGILIVKVANRISKVIL